MLEFATQVSPNSQKLEYFLLEHRFHEPETVTPTNRSNYTHPVAFPTQTQYRSDRGSAISSCQLVLKKSLSHTALYWKTEIAPPRAFVCLAGRKEGAPGKTNPKGLESQTLSIIHEESPTHIFIVPFSGVRLGEPPAAASLRAQHMAMGWIRDPHMLLRGVWKTEASTDTSSGKHRC